MAVVGCECYRIIRSECCVSVKEDAERIPKYVKAIIHRNSGGNHIKIIAMVEGYIAA
jgi:hypothetical protein